MHVYDVSHPDREAQIDHVRKTLKKLSDGDKPLIEVANKCDLVNENNMPENSTEISATQGIGKQYKINSI